jgi:hypothetical protein
MIYSLLLLGGFVAGLWCGFMWGTAYFYRCEMAELRRLQASDCRREAEFREFMADTEQSLAAQGFRRE